jgi:DNA ligase-associated metallophosphoesterase
MTLDITINGQHFVLHPTGALYWIERGLLMIADVHLGKVSHFRKAGVSVPEASISKNFERLAAVSDYFKPKTICFLGDLFHSESNREWKLFEDWMCGCTCEVVLVAGNHDIIPAVHYQALCVQVVGDWEIDGFWLTHHPKMREGFFNFCGHIHPSVLLVGAGRQSLKLPCFFRKPAQMILPAFGHFTGTCEMAPCKGDVVYVVANEKVVEIKSR